MWKALKLVQDSNATLDAFAVDELIERARSQRDRLEAKRLEVAPQAPAHTANV